ncbi:hypothetical protein GCM10023114_18670 [Mycolicibacterium sediminis]
MRLPWTTMPVGPAPTGIVPPDLSCPGRTVAVAVVAAAATFAVPDVGGAPVDVDVVVDTNCAD